MSSPGIQSINSGPLIIRTYNQSINTLSTNNTYLLGQYDLPIPTNYILITTLNGQLAPTNNPTISSFNISTLNINNGYLSSFDASTIRPSTILCSTLIVSTSANLRYDTIPLSIPTNSNVNITNTYWGEYVFLTPTSGTASISLLNSGVNIPSNGTTIFFKNIGPISVTTNGLSGESPTTTTIAPQSTLQVLYFSSKWYTM